MINMIIENVVLYFDANEKRVHIQVGSPASVQLLNDFTASHKL